MRLCNVSFFRKQWKIPILQVMVIHTNTLQSNNGSEIIRLHQWPTRSYETSNWHPIYLYVQLYRSGTKDYHVLLNKDGSLVHSDLWLSPSSFYMRYHSFFLLYRWCFSSIIEHLYILIAHLSKVWLLNREEICPFLFNRWSFVYQYLIFRRCHFRIERRRPSQFLLLNRNLCT